MKILAVVQETYITSPFVLDNNVSDLESCGNQIGKEFILIIKSHIVISSVFSFICNILSEVLYVVIPCCFCCQRKLRNG